MNLFHKPVNCRIQVILAIISIFVVPSETILSLHLIANELISGFEIIWLGTINYLIFVIIIPYIRIQKKLEGILTLVGVMVLAWILTLLIVMVYQIGISFLHLIVLIIPTVVSIAIGIRVKKLSTKWNEQFDK